MPRAKNGSSTKIGVVWQKSDFWAKNRNFGPKKRHSLFDSNHVLATTGKSCSKKKSASLFLGPKFQFLAKKSDFCHTTPILVDDPFLALGMTVNFPPWERFFDFLIRSYSCFRKKIWLTPQKVFPPPTLGVPSSSKSPSALSARA